MDNSSKTFTLISGVVAFVLVFVLFVIILMTQAYTSDDKSLATKRADQQAVSNTPKVKPAQKKVEKIKSDVSEQSVNVGDDIPTATIDEDADNSRQRVQVGR